MIDREIKIQVSLHKERELKRVCDNHSKEKRGEHDKNDTYNFNESANALTRTDKHFSQGLAIRTSEKARKAEEPQSI